MPNPAGSVMNFCNVEMHFLDRNEMSEKVAINLKICRKLTQDHASMEESASHPISVAFFFDRVLQVILEPT